MNSNTNTRGVLFMIASMCAFAGADTLVKVSTATISTAQVMFYLMGGGLIVFALLAKWRGDKLRTTKAFSAVFLLRYVSEITGMVGMVNALANVPISSVGAITQASPLLAAVGAVLFLRERVGWRRWSSIIVGFIGVLFIVQPGATEFDVNILWALLAVVSLSVRDVTTRMIPADIPSASLATYTMMAAVPFTLVWLQFNGESMFPTQTNWFVIVPMVVLGAVGYMLLITSLRMAEVSVVMPFRYTRVLFLIVVGVIVFDEIPDVWMLLGAGLIIGSGVYMMWREQQVNKRTNIPTA